MLCSFFLFFVSNKLIVVDVLFDSYISLKLKIRVWVHKHSSEQERRRIAKLKS